MTDLQAITDTVQTVNLILFAAGLIIAVLLARRFEWSRMWLIPPATWLINGAAFYVIVALDLWDGSTRTLWSAGLRLHSALLMVIGLCTVYWMAVKDGKK